MSIYFSGTFTRSAGIISAITKELKFVNLKPVKKIEVQFDPFHQNAITVRDFLHFITSAKVTNTNLNCKIKTNIVCDRSEPQIKIDLIDSGSVKFLANNLTVLEIFQQFNKHISSQVKIEEPISTVIPIKTKLQKKLKK
ncbi:39S ribosomal protein L53/MRP-L53 [Popillia japonica]|uniref:Large ribosomal subunit protein mL53 n=1 Tax=Popillia japonica TaxID=7064 RepID=A0AAW1L9H7_POPJA